MIDLDCKTEILMEIDKLKYSVAIMKNKEDLQRVLDAFQKKCKSLLK